MKTRVAPCLLLAAALSACGPSPARSAADPEPASANALTPTPSRTAPEPQASSEQIPIDADDAVWGFGMAPVTLVVFTDLQCPYCAEGHATEVALERRYGEARLRVVFKHLPLSAHAGAVPAARVAQAVLAVAGRGKFFEYVDWAFQRQADIAAGRALDLVKPLGVDVKAVLARAESPESGREVLNDVMLADRLQVPATPHYRLNGRGITGVRPPQLFIELIDEELDATQKLRAAGVGAEAVYAARVRENLRLPEP